MQTETLEQAKVEAPAEAQPKRISSTVRVLDAVRELRALDQIATRETVAELTGLKLSVVDDRLSALVGDEKLKRLLRGIYELVEEYPPKRNVSKTILDSGYILIEIAGRDGTPDVVLHLTPSEDRALSMLCVGAAGQAILINSTNEHLYLATQLAARVERLERENKAFRAHRSDGNQQTLDLA